MTPYSTYNADTRTYTSPYGEYRILPADQSESEESVSTVFGNALETLKQAATTCRDFLYDVYCVDLKDMDAEKAGEYRTYKIVAAIVTMIVGALLAVGGVFAATALVTATTSTLATLAFLACTTMPALGTTAAAILKSADLLDEVSAHDERAELNRFVARSQVNEADMY